MYKASVLARILRHESNFFTRFARRGKIKEANPCLASVSLLLSILKSERRARGALAGVYKLPELMHFYGYTPGNICSSSFLEFSWEAEEKEEEEDEMRLFDQFSVGAISRPVACFRQDDEGDERNRLGIGERERFGR